VPINFDKLNIKDKKTYLENMRHSAAHVLAESVKKIYPSAKLTIGPSIEDGFFYDFDVAEPFTPNDLASIEKEMQKSINRDTYFSEREVTREFAKSLVKDNPYKLEILAGIPSTEKITLCSHSNGDFEDLCRGGHVEKTGDIKAFKLMSASGAYWRGKENNPMLQRIYGTAWESKKSLKKFLIQREEAAKRDHRTIGRDLQLFYFDAVAPASPFFLPNGTVILNELYSFIRDLYKKYNYDEVVTPEIFNTDLWKKSGHYANYSDSMYFINIDDFEYGVKPMNCPAAALLYKSLFHSYRELPLRFADFGRLHRYEKSGVTHGLNRVRTFTQDDAHIFCTIDQIDDEIKSFLNMLSESYKVFGFNNMRFTLSLRPEKRVGSDDLWDRAETTLQKILDGSTYDYSLEKGEGAFYGPKIDVFVPDAIGREWQLGTVQLDFSLPERFELEYTEESGSRVKCVVIHRAMLGSMERFLGVLIEHTAGSLPLWISPLQVVAIPIADRHRQYCKSIVDKLKLSNFRARVDESNERMNAKIRTAQLKKVPYMIICGDKEYQNNSISIRSRDGINQEIINIDDFIDVLNNERSNRLYSHR
jgi:threonyl-tRNA synthetase